MDHWATYLNTHIGGISLHTKTKEEINRNKWPKESDKGKNITTLAGEKQKINILSNFQQNIN